VKDDQGQDIVQYKGDAGVSTDDMVAGQLRNNYSRPAGQNVGVSDAGVDHHDESFDHIRSAFDSYSSCCGIAHEWSVHLHKCHLYFCRIEMSRGNPGGEKTNKLMSCESTTTSKAISSQH